MRIASVNIQVGVSGFELTYSSFPTGNCLSKKKVSAHPKLGPCTAGEADRHLPLPQATMCCVCVVSLFLYYHSCSLALTLDTAGDLLYDGEYYCTT